MAEIEYKGIKVGGSKLLLILPLIGTLIGGPMGRLWSVSAIHHNGKKD